MPSHPVKVCRVSCAVCRVLCGEVLKQMVSLPEWQESEDRVSKLVERVNLVLQKQPDWAVPVLCKDESVLKYLVQITLERRKQRACMIAMSFTNMLSRTRFHP